MAPRSIILTTLAAIHYSGAVSVAEAVGNIIDGILRSVPATSGKRLIVLNPMNDKEDFSESWNQPQRYLAFLTFMKEFSVSWRQLQHAKGIPAIKAILEKLFGEDVTGVVIEEQIRNFNQAREHQALGIAGAGILTHVEAPHVVRVPKHTYRGK